MLVKGRLGIALGVAGGLAGVGIAGYGFHDAMQKERQWMDQVADWISKDSSIDSIARKK